MLLCFSIFLHPLVLCWIWSHCVSYCLRTSSSDYVDIYSIVLGLYRDPLNILVVLVPLFLNFSQKCWAFLCIMVCCATVHTCRRWKWTFPCIMSWMLQLWHTNGPLPLPNPPLPRPHLYIQFYLLVVCCTEVPDYTARGYTMVVCYYIAVVQCYTILCSIVWRWYLVKLRCNFPCHHFFLHPIGF
jgi:hypothetical protein